MTTTQKREIAYRLRVYVGTYSSQKKAVDSLTGCSEATIIGMLNDKEFGWDVISEQMWRTVASQVGNSVDFNRLVETMNFNTLILYFSLAREEGATFAITGNAGYGKTYAAKYYAAANRKNNVFYLECAEYWNKKQFLCKLLSQMGKNGFGYSVSELMDILVREIRKMEHPVIIMDEIDKLPDPVLRFFITLYNELNKICGFVWLSTNAIEKRMTLNINRNTVGYQELFSRIGAQFIELTMPSVDEVREICMVNGIEGTEDIARVVNEVRDLKGDLRRVDRNILKSKVKKIRKSNKAA